MWTGMTARQTESERAGGSRRCSRRPTNANEQWSSRANAWQRLHVTNHHKKKDVEREWRVWEPWSTSVCLCDCMRVHVLTHWSARAASGTVYALLLYIQIEVFFKHQMTNEQNKWINTNKSLRNFSIICSNVGQRIAFLSHFEMRCIVVAVTAHHTYMHMLTINTHTYIFTERLKYKTQALKYISRR